MVFRVHMEVCALAYIKLLACFSTFLVVVICHTSAFSQASLGTDSAASSMTSLQGTKYFLNGVDTFVQTKKMILLE